MCAVQYVCRHCGLSFTGHKRKFCTEKCRNHASKELRECVRCGKEYQCERRRPQKHCSVSCSQKSRVEREGRKRKSCNCGWCGKDYLIQIRGGGRVGKYCSRECYLRRMCYTAKVRRVQEVFLDILNSSINREYRCDLPMCNSCKQRFRPAYRMQFRCERPACSSSPVYERTASSISPCVGCNRVIANISNTRPVSVCGECRSSRKSKQRRINKARRRALKRGSEAVDPIDVFERDGWICKLCGYHVDNTVGPNHVDSPQIDHIIPLSRGGKHTMNNLQCSHRGCNMSKSNFLPMELVLKGLLTVERAEAMVTQSGVDGGTFDSC